MRARPQELELILVGISLGEEVSRETVMLSGDSQNWSYTWANLPTTRKGEAVDYTLSVADVKGYSSVLVDNGDGTFTVTNTYVRDPNYEYFTVNVVWNDSNNAAGRRPSSLDAELELYLRLFDTWEWMSFDDPVSLSDEYNWRAAFPVSKALIRDMDIRDFRIVLTDDYNDIIGYFDPVITRTGNDWTISFDACAVLSVKIEWKGDNDNELLTRDAVEVDLFKRYTDHWNVLPDTISQTVTLDETNNWEYTWTKLPLTEAGLNLSYYVSLVSNNVTGYQYGTTARKGETTVIDFTLLPDYEPRRTNVNVTLDWKDEDGSSRPDEMEVTLYADGDEVETVKLYAGNNWEYTWTNLLEKKGSANIDYTVTPTKIHGYTLNSDISRTESTENKPGSVDIVITNTASVSVTVKIEWMDLDSPTRPTELEVRLYRGTGYREGFDAANNPDGLTELLNEELVYWFDENGKPSEGRIVKASDGWTYTWENLLKYNNNGEKYVYTVRELVPEEYSVYLSEENGVFTLLNKSCDLTNITLRKNWHDENNLFGKRPDKIFVNLFKRDEDNPKWEFFRKVQIAAVKESIIVEKLWDEDSEETPPETIEITLTGVVTKDGKKEEVLKYDVTVSYNADLAGWAYTWNDLDVFDVDGNDIVYTVKAGEEVLDYTYDKYCWEVLEQEIPYYPGVEYKIEEENVDGYGAPVIVISGELISGDYTVDINNYIENADVTVKKTVQDADASENADFTFTVTLKDGDGADASLLNDSYSYSNEDGTITGTISHGKGTITLKHNQSVTIHDLPVGTYYEIVENATSGYTLISEGTIANGFSGIVTNDAATVEFVNKKNTPAVEQFRATKTITGDRTELLTGIDVYTFKLSRAEGSDNHMPTGEGLSADGNSYTVTNSGSSITFPEITYSVDLANNASKTYTYTLEEVAGADNVGITYSSVKYTVTVTVTNTNGVYSTAVVYSKEDETVNQNDVIFENTYTYKAPTPETTLALTKSFVGPVTGGKTFKFIVTRTSAHSGEDVPVGKNVPVFGTNNQKEVTVTVTKGTDGKYTGSETIHFETYSVPGTYIYTVAEDSSEPSTGVLYDPTVYTVTVTVTDNNLGTLLVDCAVTKTDDKNVTSTFDAKNGLPFENTYDPGDIDVTFTGTKTVTPAEGFSYNWGSADNRAYSFTLKPAADIPEGGRAGIMPDGKTSVTVRNKNDGSITFPTVTFDATGTYYYTLTEDNLGEAAPGGVHKDTTEITIKVDITDVGGELNAAVTYSYSSDRADTTASFVFDNEFAPGSIIIKGTKNIVNRDWGEDDNRAYSFTLEPITENAPMPDGTVNNKKTVQNVGHEINFGQIIYLKSGRYQYKITE